MTTRDEFGSRTERFDESVRAASIGSHFFKISSATFSGEGAVA